MLKFFKAALLTLLLSPTISFAALSDHCDWPTQSDVFSERASGYVVTSSDWNLTQCVLNQIQAELGLTGNPNYVKLDATNSYTGQQVYGSTAIFNNFVNFNDVVTFADLNTCDLAVGASGEVICSATGGDIPAELAITYDSDTKKITFNNTVATGVHEFSDQLNVAVNSTTGNRLTVFSNTITNGDTTCPTRGKANSLTIIDSDATATNTWDICSGTSTLFRIPSTAVTPGHDAKVDVDEVFIGTNANQGWWTAIPRCTPSTQKLVYSANGFTCETDSGGSGSVSGPGTTTNTALALWSGTAGTALLNSGITVSGDAMTFPDLQSSGGNLIGLLDNDGSSTTDCATAGAAGKFTLIDKNNTATDDWVLCNGTSELFNIPNSGTSIIADNQIFVGTGANAGSYITIPNCDDSTQKLDFNNTAFSCITDMGTGGGGGVSGPGSSTNNAIAVWNGTGGTLLANTGITISSDSMTFPDKEGVTGGNYIGVLDNDNGSFSTTCTNAGAAGRFTLVDKDNSASDQWVMCNGTSEYFIFPQTNSTILDDNKVLVGTSANQGAYTAIPSNCTTAINFDGTSFSCGSNLAQTSVANSFTANQTITNSSPTNTEAKLSIVGNPAIIEITNAGPAPDVSAIIQIANETGAYVTRIKFPDWVVLESDSGDSTFKSHLVWSTGSLSYDPSNLGTGIGASATSLGTDAARWGNIYGEDISVSGQVRLKQTQTKNTGSTGIITMPTKTRVELQAGSLAELRCITYTSSDSSDDGNIVIAKKLAGGGGIIVRNNSVSCSGSNEPLRLYNGQDKLLLNEYDNIIFMYEADCGCWVQIGGRFDEEGL